MVVVYSSVTPIREMDQRRVYKYSVKLPEIMRLACEERCVCTEKKITAGRLGGIVQRGCKSKKGLLHKSRSLVI